jgi:hypothetical protein
MHINHGGSDFAFPFQHADHDGFAESSFGSLHLQSLIAVHVPSVATDVGFVHFHFPHELAINGSFLQGQPNAVHHEPGSFLSDAKATGDLVGTHAILGADNHPQCAKPFIERDRTILKNSAELRSVLLSAIFALPHGARFQKSMSLRLASWTHWTMWPAHGR